MSQPTTPAPTKPARSPVERVIVWGVIAIGLIVIGIEAKSHLAHAAALSKLQGQVKENSEKDTGITKKDVDQIVGDKVPEVEKLNPMATSMGASRVDVYTYPGLLRSRKLYVYYGIAGKKTEQEAEVMEVGSVPAESLAEAMAKLPKPDPNAQPVAPPGMGGPGAGGPGAGGPGAGGPGGGGPGAGGRPAAEKKSDDAAKEEGTEPEAKSDEKPEAEKKADGDAKPDEAKPDEAKPDEAKPESEKPAEAEPKKE